MNLLHLKYAVVIAETNSMTKASEKLYTAQPNLSRAVRELESTLGITIFKRTPQGIFPTQEGEEFLGYARKVLAQVDAIEEIYRGEKKKVLKFSISVPRASYISCAFTEFVKSLKPDADEELFYKETNALRAINNILEADYNLGIIRYQDIYEDNFREMLEEKGLNREVIFDFRYFLLFSQKHPLASRKQISLSDLAPYTEIAHADPYVPVHAAFHRAEKRALGGH
jgi:DNA-binding transcriptional LysR family regulator